MNSNLVSKIKEELEKSNKKIIRDKITQSLFGSENKGFANNKTNDEMLIKIDEMVNELNDSLLSNGLGGLESKIKELQI